MNALLAGGCARLHLGTMPRDPALVGEWVDVRHTSTGDTALWVLRADGYDGTAHILSQSDGPATRHDTRYARWYMRGSMDSADRAICFARRPGRDGVTCLGFSLDTISTATGPARRLTVRGYEGQHTTGTRILVERK